MQIKYRLQTETVGFDERGQQEMDISTGGSFIMDDGLVVWTEVTVSS